ncbi:hypothetical protein BCR42DRAFT_383634 [Absidia repens]|uniref:Protein phosphatase 1 regulatory subunit 7 n=1 Tax=Absidia repens TaxID=90262 RepID=A0A1X2I0S5_9FUNG|nr:hypothetical protein BCR42DRAFT_383634 [Absidia repens]
MKLDFDVLSTWYDQPLDTIKEINAKKKDLKLVEDISSCSKLRKLILSENFLTNAKTSFIGLNQLTFLNLSHNEFNSLSGMEHLTQLNVLNVSNNMIKTLPGDMSHFANLKALIVNNNELEETPNLAPLVNLNTLVISHNNIQEVSDLSCLSNLVKLSASYNKLKEIPDFSGQKDSLKETRLNDNDIDTIPNTLRKCQALEIIDLGNNKIENWSDIASLGSLLKLHNLNLRGNPITNKKDYKDKILNLIPSLRVLDGERFDLKFLERKQKQATNFKLMEKKDRLKREKLEKLEKQWEVADESSSTRKPRHKHVLREEKDDQQPGPAKATKTKVKAAIENEMDVDKEKRKSTKTKIPSNATDVDKEDHKKTMKKTKAQRDPFFDAKAAESANMSDTATAPVTAPVTASVTAPAAVATTTTATPNESVASTKTSLTPTATALEQKLSKRKAEAQISRSEHTGVLSRVDNSKKMKKKVDSEDVLATLEKTKEQEESVSTGLGADSWD